MLIIHDERIPSEYLDAIRHRLPDARLLPFGGPPAAKGGTYDSIRCHPDIYFFQVDDNTLVHAPCVPQGLLSELKRAGVHLVSGGKDPSGSYPGTIPYNAARAGDVVLHNTRYSDGILAEEIRKRKKRSVHVEQGYAACSTVPVGSTALITSDAGIAGAAGREGLDALLISPGQVTLPGEKYGFIGGASGILPGGDILFLGDIAEHPDHAKILDFAAAHGAGSMSLERLPLYDGGKLFVFSDEI